MKPLLLKIAATFTYHAGSILPTASILGGWAIWKAALTAGVSAVVQVLVEESRAYLAKSRKVEGDE
jgi:hypothetical protein